MGTTKISAGGQKKSFREGTTINDLGRGTIFKSQGMGREGVGRKFFSRNKQFGKKILPKNRKSRKTDHFSCIFNGTGRG